MRVSAEERGRGNGESNGGREGGGEGGEGGREGKIKREGARKEEGEAELSKRRVMGEECSHLQSYN